MTPLEILARTTWGEARGEQAAGMVAVACVIRNRVHDPGWWGHDYPSVCQHPAQFSCWNAHDPNRAKLLAVTAADPQYAEALRIAADVMSGHQADTTGGADAYADLEFCSPGWAAGARVTVVVGRHTFFRVG